MPRQPRREKIACRYFTWQLSRRGSVWQANGRSNRPNLGRHSLGTEDRREAGRLLVDLDLTMAVRHGLADPGTVSASRPTDLPMLEGCRLYLNFVNRPPVVGGVRPSSAKRYRAVMDKFCRFASDRGLTDWGRVTAQTLSDYAAHLEVEGYAHRTEYLELTTIKQAVLWMAKQGHLPADTKIDLSMEKATGTPTYCWQADEVVAMIDHCFAQEETIWLGRVIKTLALTGVRISELATLRWEDIDLPSNMIRLEDESTSSRRGRADATARTLKGGIGRSFPIHEDLLRIFGSMTRTSDGYVFHGPRGGRLKPDVVRQCLIRDVLTPLAERFPSSGRAKGFVDGRLHSFRHFFCSLCANQNVPQRVVMRWLGHTESRMVEHYYHLHDDEARRQMGRISLAGEMAVGVKPGGQ